MQFQRHISKYPVVAKILGALIPFVFASYTPGLGNYGGVQSNMARNLLKLREKCEIGRISSLIKIQSCSSPHLSARHHSYLECPHALSTQKTACLYLFLRPRDIPMCVAETALGKLQFSHRNCDTARARAASNMIPSVIMLPRGLTCTP